MPEIERAEKRQGLHLAWFCNTLVESKRNSLAPSPKVRFKCESRAKLKLRLSAPQPPGYAADHSHYGSGKGGPAVEAMPDQLPFSSQKVTDRDKRAHPSETAGISV